MVVIYFILPIKIFNMTVVYLIGKLKYIGKDRLMKSSSLEI